MRGPETVKGDRSRKNYLPKNWQKRGPALGYDALLQNHR